MEIEIGKTYVSYEYGGVKVKINNINNNKGTVGITVTKNISDKYQVKCDSLLSKNHPLVKSLKPIDDIDKQLKESHIYQRFVKIL